jgi:hypothetical protein
VKRSRKSLGLKNRSQAVEEAFKLLIQRDLETAYRESAADDEATVRAWDITTSAGLPDETW